MNATMLQLTRLDLEDWFEAAKFYTISKTTSRTSFPWKETLPLEFPKAPKLQE